MNRVVLRAFAALLLTAAGTFWWQGRAAVDPGSPPPPAPEAIGAELDLPSADASGMVGPPLPEAREASREQRRFNRLDRDQDQSISRAEMLSTRTRDFRKLDVDGNNLLTFEEWAVATANRFRAADRDGNFSSPAPNSQRRSLSLRPSLPANVSGRLPGSRL